MSIFILCPICLASSNRCLHPEKDKLMHWESLSTSQRNFINAKAGEYELSIYNRAQQQMPPNSFQEYLRQHQYMASQQVQITRPWPFARQEQQSSDSKKSEDSRNKRNKILLIRRLK